MGLFLIEWRKLRARKVDVMLKLNDGTEIDGAVFGEGWVCRCDEGECVEFAVRFKGSSESGLKAKVFKILRSVVCNDPFNIIHVATDQLRVYPPLWKGFKVSGILIFDQSPVFDVDSVDQTCKIRRKT